MAEFAHYFSVTTSGEGKGDRYFFETLKTKDQTEKVACPPFPGSEFYALFN
jgi:hypothetical protein